MEKIMTKKLNQKIAVTKKAIEFSVGSLQHDPLTQYFIKDFVQKCARSKFEFKDVIQKPEVVKALDQRDMVKLEEILELT
jgi:hypothetical protein